MTSTTPQRPTEQELQHAQELDAWLEDGDPARLARCRSYAERGIAARDPDCLQYAVSAIVARSLDDPARSEALALLEFYIDTGVLCLDQPLETVRPIRIEYHDRLPLQHAIMNRRLDCVELMIRKGALAVTDLRTQRMPGAAQKYPPAPSETADDAFFRWTNSYFGGAASRATIMQAVMNCKLSATSDAPKAQPPAARRERRL